jgi:hypothetical protein
MVIRLLLTVDRKRITLFIEEKRLLCVHLRSCLRKHSVLCFRVREANDRGICFESLGSLFHLPSSRFEYSLFLKAIQVLGLLYLLQQSLPFLYSSSTLSHGSDS